MGVGLAAACGFRIFVPLLIVSLASHAGHISLAEGFEWLDSTPAIICLSVAVILEVGAYYIPWLDNLLDSIATPCAVIAGTLLAAAMISGMSPWLKWTLAVIAGGGAAGLVQTVTVAVRGASTAGTGGIATPVISTAELGGSAALGGLAVFAPVAAIIAFPCVTGFLGWKFFSRGGSASTGRVNTASPEHGPGESSE